MTDENNTTKEQNGMVWVDDRIYIPNDKELREEILTEHHEPATLGHLGQRKMLELIKRTYWGPKMKTDVEKFT